MKKTVWIVVAVICLLKIGNAIAISDSDPDLERTLLRYNQWKSLHPNAIVRFKASQDGVNEIVTSYYFGKKFKVVTEVPTDGGSACYIEFLSDNGDVLNYFPQTGLTVKEDSPLKVYVLKEMGWDQELTAAKAEYFGGKLKYRRKDNRDCLVLNLPWHPLERAPSEKPATNYNGTLELEIDEDGKPVRQIATFRHFRPAVADLECITFDGEKVKTEYDSIVVKSIVNTNASLEAVFAAELKKTSTSARSSSGTLSWIVLGLLVGAILVPMIAFRKFWAIRT